MNCCIVGIGNHSKKNLIPALKKLADKKLINIKYLCRKNIEKGDGGLNVPVISELPTDVDFIVGCGHPDMHKNIIDFSNKNKIPCFVEKPHLIKDQFVNDHTMIGYNFNFMSILSEINNFESIDCGTKGIYKSWPDLFNGKYEKYQHVFHSVAVHPISVVVQEYGQPQSVNIKDNSSDDPNNVVFVLHLKYEDSTKTINFTTESSGFFFDVNTGSETTKCKPYKATSYYNMLEHFVTSKFKTNMNNNATAKIVLNIVNDALNQIATTSKI